jgi:hypothetical protein
MKNERFNDKVKAEGVSVANLLSVEQGTVIHATRDFDALNFKEILEQHKSWATGTFYPKKADGNKFIKAKITQIR